MTTVLLLFGALLYIYTYMCIIHQYNVLEQTVYKMRTDKYNNN